jgi:hypothetical protein
METNPQLAEPKPEDDSWNSVVLSLATGGGYLIKHGTMCEIVVYAPKFDAETLLLEPKFCRYWVENKRVFELYNAVWDQQEELATLSNQKPEDRKFLDEEMERALLKYKKTNRKRKSDTIKEEPESEPGTD